MPIAWENREQGAGRTARVFLYGKTSISLSNRVKEGYWSYLLVKSFGFF